MTLTTKLNTIPLFVCEGSIIPVGPEVQYTGEKPWDELEIRVYPGRNVSFTLYEDDGTTCNYEQGKYTEITFTWNDKRHELTVSDRKGDFPSMLQNRRFRIVNVQTGAVNTVEYKGKKVVV